MITIIRAEDSPSIHFGGNPPWDDLEDLATEQDEEPVHCQVDDLFLLAGIEKSIGQPSIDWKAYSSDVAKWNRSMSKRRNLENFRID